MRQVLAWVWAAPWSAIGLAAGAIGVLGGDRLQRRGPTIEFYGDFAASILAKAPLAGGAAAMTLGHVVLGRNAAALDCCRDHERVHVRQYERWGPLFVPAYLAASAVVALRGGDSYRDNPFEREAYAVAP